MMRFGPDRRGASILALVEALAAATREGRADWIATSRPDRFLYSDSSGSVTIASAQLGAFVLKLLDPDGQVLESWRAGAVQRSDTPPGLSHALTDLYDAVATRGQRTDRVIEDMLARLNVGGRG